MKTMLFLLFTLIASVIASAQEMALETTSEPDFLMEWTDEVKIYWLSSIVLLSLFLVVRTFRNKPDA